MNDSQSANPEKFADFFITTWVVNNMLVLKPYWKY